ncbi:hypothetical protein B0T22DRAFT_494639 [Podospora appendiculata]|uniref:LrgB-like protein n=1 Tax=Podospora appendiculata TaxID=314037 RepID=A0AAE1C7K4_9PEZI|nr:hypothetical protein B0T22DRAFT_494639 [Podospora appendiculata]
MVLPQSLPAARPSSTMTTSTVAKLQLPVLLQRLCDGFQAIMLVIVAQCLIAGIEYVLGDKSHEYPPAILAMASVFMGFWLCGCFVPGTEEFYRKRLRCAADLLNRHMSIGFTIPFVMICRSPLADAHTIGLIVACFILTGLINTVSTYLLALPIQTLMVRWDKRFQQSAMTETDEATEGRTVSIFQMPAKSFCDSESTTSSSNTSLYTPGDDSSSDESGKLSLPAPAVTHWQTEFMEKSSPKADIYASGDESSPSKSELSLSASSAQTVTTDEQKSSAQPTSSLLAQSLCNFAVNSPMLLLCWLATLTIGLPLRYTNSNDPVLATTLLFSIWFTTLAIHASIKTNRTNLKPWLRTLLSGLFNAVLWTSLAMIAYVFIDGAISNRPLPAMLDTLQTNSTLLSLLTNANPRGPAAGDIALAILNAGLVSWGLKLYEYRRQLLSRAGVTVFLVSSLLALANLVFGPLLAATVGLGPAARDLAFAARSVTLALGSPVMAMLDGDAGLNAAMVVVSGIVFQMGLGFGAGAWLERRVVAACMILRDRREMRVGSGGGVLVTTTTTTVVTTVGGDVVDSSPPIAVAVVPVKGGDDLEAQNGRPAPQSIPGANGADSNGHNGSEKINDPISVAAGVTVGINAAAMGTAYLYEAKSEAAPYSALSMIALGVMTVAFAAIKPLAVFVVKTVAISASTEA